MRKLGYIPSGIAMEYDVGVAFSMNVGISEVE